MKRMMAASLLAAMGLAVHAEPATVYVATDGNDANDGSAAKPVLNLSRAVALTRAATNAPARRIVIRDGVYRVETNVVKVLKQDVNLTIEAEHSGKVLYTGAEKVTGWRKYDQDDRFLMADLPFETKPEMLYMLSVGGENAEIASFPDFGGENKMPYLASEEDSASGNRTVMKYDSLALPKGQTFEGLDLDSAWVTVPQEWATTRSYILTNDWQHDTFVFKTPINMPIGHFNTGFQIVNCRLGMRHPGMWMFESGKKRLVYWPKEGETVEKLNKIASVSRSYGFLYACQATNFVVRGITVEALAAPFRGGNPRPVAFLMDGGGGPNQVRYNMTIENCEVRDSAGEGIVFFYLNGSTIRNCHVHHLGGTGIQTEGSSFGNTVQHNHVHHCSLFNTSGACLNVSSGSSHYDFNHVHHSPYAGVVMWTGHSTFNSNHIHHVMLSSRDGGGLYGGYMFTDLIGNWTHDTGDWPGLYNDEGGQRCTFALNRFDGSWWPFHMHVCWGIVVSNNVFTCDDGMRFSFMGSCHCIFKDNVIRTTKKIVADPYLESCDEWDNLLELKQSDGSYKPAGRVSFPCNSVKLPPKGPYACHPTLCEGMNGNGQFLTWSSPACTKTVPIDRMRDGRHAHGVPGADMLITYDTTNLYWHGLYYYNVLYPYPGSKHMGTDWEKSDGIRFHFKGYQVMLFMNDPATAIDSKGWKFPKDHVEWGRVGWLGDGSYWMSVKIPWEKIGVKLAKASDLFGKELPFNVEWINHDHDEHRFYNQPDGDNYLTGRLAFAPEFETDKTFDVETSMLQTKEGVRLTGAMAPFGKIQSDIETSYRHRDDYDDVQGYQARNIKLMGYVLRDRSDRSTAGHRTFLMQPYTGKDPEGTGRRSQHMEQASLYTYAGTFGVNLQRWDLETHVAATENALFHKYRYIRGGIVKVLLDGNYADEGCTVEESEFKLDGKVLTGHIKAKAGLFKKGYEAWVKAEYNQTPVELKEIASPGKGKRYILIFDIMPQIGDIVAKFAVSEKSAADAEAKFAAEKIGTDFDKAKAAAIALWQDIYSKMYKKMSISGDWRSVRAVKTAIRGAYTMPGGEDKDFCLMQKGVDLIKVSVKGAKGPDVRVKTVTKNGEALPKKFPEEYGKEKPYFHNGDTINLVFE